MNVRQQDREYRDRIKIGQERFDRLLYRKKFIPFSIPIIMENKKNISLHSVYVCVCVLLFGAQISNDE